MVTLTQVLTQLGSTPGADGDAAGGAEDATTAGGAEDEPTTGGATELLSWTGDEAGGGATELPCCTGEDAGGAAELDATGAMHLVQMVEIEVLVTVEIVVVTCWTGVPCGGVTVFVTGHVVKVVYTLKVMLEKGSRLFRRGHLHCGGNDFLSSLGWRRCA